MIYRTRIERQHAVQFFVAISTTLTWLTTSTAIAIDKNEVGIANVTATNFEEVNHLHSDGHGHRALTRYGMVAPLSVEFSWPVWVGRWCVALALGRRIPEPAAL
jgi:hypothetical protein